MAKRRRRTKDRESVATVDYEGQEGNVLPVRERLTCGAIAKIAKIVKAGGAAATSVDCAWRRRMEMLFERLVEIGGPPLTDQTRLLGGYRMADTGTQRWVRRTIGVHPEKHIAELAGPG